MSILYELWMFIRVRKKYWLIPILLVLLLFGGLIMLDTGLSNSSIYLHFVLTATVCASSGYPRSTTTAQPPLSSTAALLQQHRKNASLRKKQDARFPAHAIVYCLGEGGITLRDVDYVVFYEKPFIKFERLLETYLAFAPEGFQSFSMAIPLWIREKLFQKDLIGKELNKLASDFDWKNRLLFIEHHMSHAASAF